MSFPILVPARNAAGRPPQLADYETVRREFSWSDARAQLSGLPERRGLNIAHEAVDRHTQGSDGARVAIRSLGKDGTRRQISYRELSELSSRFANVLSALGVAAGDLVCTLLGRTPELFVTALGALKHRALFSPLFSAFGPDPIKTRLTLGEAKVLVTTRKLHESKVSGLRSELPHLHTVLVIDGEPDASWRTLSFPEALAGAADNYLIAPTRPDDPALVHFTSGTTGRPKAALHVHEAVLMHHVTARFALDLSADDVFWCTADPGWVTGTSYGIIAPLSHGCTLVLDEREFDVQRWYDVLEQERVSVFYTAPTAIRRMMRAGSEVARARDLSALRLLASVGEPLNPEAVMFGQAAFGRPFLDNWWQTETGGIMIANYPSLAVKPGSMGKPLPGVEACVVERCEDGSVRELGPEQVGELAIRRGWPSMFRAYLGEPERYQRCFAGDLYLSGDLVRRDDDGYFWFVGRSDDVIKTAGHLVGPFELESALMEHPAVAEAAAIGKPDPLAGELIKAFVCLRAGHTRSPELEGELLGFARKRLGAAIAPRELAIVEELPRTRSGKILRRLLRARELGLPEGDLSTLEASR